MLPARGTITLFNSFFRGDVANNRGHGCHISYDLVYSSSHYCPENDNSGPRIVWVDTTIFVTTKVIINGKIF